jgi:Haem-binding domain
VTEAIREGSMPPWYYRLLHPAARLSDAELERLIAGLEATFRASPPS